MNDNKNPFLKLRSRISESYSLLCLWATTKLQQKKKKKKKKKKKNKKKKKKKKKKKNINLQPDQQQSFYKGMFPLKNVGSILHPDLG